MAKSRAGARKKEPEDVRGRVLQAAVQLIDRGGLASLSMREVAREAGVSHQAPYHWFEDREAILAAIAEEGFHLLSARLEAAKAASATGPEQLEHLGRAYVQFACDQPSTFRVMFRPDFVDHDRFPSLLACGATAFENLPATVQRLVAEGFPDEPAFETHVILMWSTVHGLACLLLDGPLAMKLPSSVTERERTIEDVIHAMRLLVEARMTTKKPPPRKRK